MQLSDMATWIRNFHYLFRFGHFGLLLSRQEEMHEYNLYLCKLDLSSFYVTIIFSNKNRKSNSLLLVTKYKFSYNSIYEKAIPIGKIIVYLCPSTTCIVISNMITISMDLNAAFIWKPYAFPLINIHFHNKIALGFH